MALRYPYKKISLSDDYLKIEVLKYSPPGLETQKNSFALNTSDQTYGTGQKITILETIFLPIPETIGDSNSAQWGASQLGPVEAKLASTASKVMNDPSKVLGILGGEAKDAASALGTGIAQQAMQKGAAGLAMRALMGKGENYLERGAGITFNENIELIFKGVNLRTPFEFSFTMVPRSEKEAEQVKSIIKSFKKFSAVGKGNEGGGAAGLFLKAPQVFRLTYMSGGGSHPFLNKFKVCALENMSVNYTGSGTYATYADATPIHIVLSLSFQELTPIYYEDYLGDGGGVGY